MRMLAWLLVPLLGWSLVELRADLGSVPALIVRSLQIGAGIWLFRRVLDRRSGLTDRPIPASLRLLLYGAFLGVAIPTIVTGIGFMLPDDDRLGSLFRSSLLLGLSLFGIGMVGPRSRERRAPSGILRAVDLVAFNVVVGLLLAEVALTILQRVRPSQILWNDSSVAQTILALRQCQGASHLRAPGGGPAFVYRCNSRGYPDHEFFDAGEEDYVVALLADSFGTGSVPFEYNFGTVAERALERSLGDRFDRVAVHNFGINGADMREYVYLLETEILDVNPSQVVLAIFIGNDLSADDETEAEARAHRWIRLQDWLLGVTVDRLRKVAEGLEWQTAEDDPQTTLVPDFIEDPSLEPPFFTEEVFLRMEKSRARLCESTDPQIRELYHTFFARLELFKEALGPKLLVVVIPDEFQVNDELWNRLPKKMGGVNRDYPQLRIRDWADKNGVRVLDLLPALREAEAEGRTYHLRDTHWNARGNRIAGEALATALLEAVPDETSN